MLPRQTNRTLTGRSLVELEIMIGECLRDWRKKVAGITELSFSELFRDDGAGGAVIDRFLSCPYRVHCFL